MPRGLQRILGTPHLKGRRWLGRSARCRCAGDRCQSNGGFGAKFNIEVRAGAARLLHPPFTLQRSRRCQAKRYFPSISACGAGR
jgi:hypothetical protein